MISCDVFIGNKECYHLFARASHLSTRLNSKNSMESVLKQNGHEVGAPYRKRYKGLQKPQCDGCALELH